MKRERSESPLRAANSKIRPSDIKTDEAHDKVHPRLDTYSARFATAEEAVESIVNDFTAKYRQRKAAGYVNTDIDRAASELEPYSKLAQQYPEIPPVTFYGVMGSGKSLTLSCVLGVPNISVDSDSSTRCTRLVHEICAAERWQQCKFQVNACFYSLEEIEETVERRCKDIFTYLRCIDENIDEEELEAEEQEDQREDYTATIHYFHTLACGDPMFETESALKQYFSNEYEQNKTAALESSPHDVVPERVVGAIMTAIRDLVTSRQLVNGEERRSADTTEQLSAALDEISGTGSPAGPHPWGIIRKIKIHCDLAILREGISIADTPGIFDSDRTIVEGTHAYIQRESQGPVFIVTPIERCGENSELDRIVKDMHRWNRQEQTFAILTKTDRINEMTPRTREKLGPGHLAELCKLEESMKLFEKDSQDLESQLSSIAQPPSTIEGFHELLAVTNRQKALSDSTAQAENRIKQIAVEDRNAKAKACLKDKFRTLTGLAHAPDLEAVCVSGSEYRKILERTTGKNAPWLTEEGTGIPELRRLIVRLPALKKFDVLQEICKHRLPHLFNRIARSLKKPVVGESIIGAHDLRDRLLGSWKGYQKSVTGSLSTKMQQAYDANIAQYLHDMSSSDAWKEDAGDLIEQWRKFHPVNFRSFCRKFGIWRTTNKRKSMNWNMSIESILSAELAAAHAAVSSAALEVDGEVEAGFVDFSQKLESLLKEKIYQKLPDKDGLRSDVRNAHSEMRTHVKDVFSQLTRGLDEMYVKSSMGDGEPTSYVSQAMHEGYVKAAAVDRRHFDVGLKEKGREAHRVRVDIIRKQVLGYAGDPTNNKPAVPNVVDAVASLSLGDFNVKLCTARTELGNILRKTIDSILSDFDSRYTPRDPPPSEDAHHIEILLRSATEATSELGKSIPAHLEACQDHEKTAAYAHTLE